MSDEELPSSRDPIDVEGPLPWERPPRPLFRKGFFLVLGIAVVGVGIVVGAAYVLTHRGGPALDATFGGTDALPYSLAYPSDWGPQSQGREVVLSPVDAFDSTTAENAMKSTPERFVGVFLEPLGEASTASDQALTGAGATIDSRSTLEVDGRAATRLVVTEPPTGGDPEIRYVLYRIDVGAGAVLLMGFFGTDPSFDAGLFDRVAATVSFDETRLQAALQRFSSPQPPLPSPTPTPSTQG